MAQLAFGCVSCAARTTCLNHMNIFSENDIVNALLYDGREVIGYVGEVDKHLVRVIYACGDPAGWTPASVVHKATTEQEALFTKEREELGLLPLEDM
jgi:ferredoxin